MQRFKFLAWPFYIVCILFIFLISCKPKRYIYKSPAHYNFSTVLRDKLDLKIKEISGIVWDNQNDEFIAHNDEKGIIYYLDRDTKGIKREFVFSETKGDYEDIAIAKKDVALFKRSFIFLTNTCNNCHQSVNYDFNKIKIPNTPPFSNQVFKIYSAK